MTRGADRVIGGLGMWLAALAVASTILALAIAAKPAEAATTARSIEAEKMLGAGKVFRDRAASNNRARVFYRASGASQRVSGPIKLIAVRARGDLCGKPPRMIVLVDGKRVMARWVRNQKKWLYYRKRVSIPGGRHRVVVRFINDRYTRRCDRNLRLDKLRFAIARNPAPSAPVPNLRSVKNPFKGQQFYANHYPAKKQAEKWRARPAYARQMDKIARNPVVQYYSTWANRKHVDNYVSTVTAAGKLPVIGIYGVPNRDCGGYSAGGFNNAAQYRAWIDEMAAGIGSRKVVVIVEPDAVAGWDCLSPSQRAERVGVLKYAVRKLKSNPATYVYIDAGHPRWHTARDTASRLRQVNINLADGFTLNHSNFFRTADNIAYGKKVSALTGGKHFVIDTSRNGNGPTAGYNWCNPQGRALGTEPTANTGQPLVDAFFWLKTPGESDGTCGGYPGGGNWLPGYALGLAQRAAY